jgi:2-polyprenyl-6-methoxyphenol hydroxylase-like FAD-dependent oxidoreductase
LELRRRGIECRVVDRLPSPAMVAKAVGIQPRTLEIWEAAGLAQDALDAATQLHGQKVFVNGEQTAELTLTLPPSVPFGFVALPQYETERVLTEQLRRLGTSVERGLELVRFDQDADGVTARLSGSQGSETARAGFLVGCDGAHSVVRRGLGLDFAGDAFPEEYMLGDVEVDWSQPPGLGIRAMHQVDGKVDDLLVCIPLPGRNRYRMSMLVPPELATKPPAAGEVAHGLEASRPPGGYPTSRPSSTGWRRSRRRHRSCAGRRSSGSATGSSTAMARPGLRCRECGAYPPPDGRAGHEHGDPGRLQPGLEAGPRGARGGSLGTARQLRRRTSPGR